MFLEAAAFTVISLGIHDANLDQHLKTSDVYKVGISISPPRHREAGGFVSVGYAYTTALPISFVGNALANFTTWNMGSNALAVAMDSDIHLAFDNVGIDRNVGDKFLDLAKGILAELNYPNIKVTPSFARDPEENASYLTLCLHVNASFEESLALDSKLTRELVYRTDNIPENLTFAVYEME